MSFFNVPIHIDHAATAPALSAQIEAAVRQGILGGTIPAGAKLPPARILARELGINPVTVVTAYRHLTATGLTASRIGSGTYVCQPLSGTAPAAAAPAPEHLLPEEAAFPTAAIKRIMTHILDTEGARAFGYDDGGGYEPLQRALRRLLTDTGVALDGRELVIFSGAQQGLSVIIHALVQRDDWVLVERPTYPGILRLLQRAGARLACMDMTADGPDLRACERLFKTRPVKLLYAMPTYQTPTGLCYGAAARRRLLELCREHGVMLVEDDARSDLDYGHGRRPPLVCEARTTDALLYLKSFSQLLMPGFRLAFCLAPKPVAAVLRQAKQETDLATSGFFQRVLYYFLENGYCQEHVARLETGIQKHFRQALAAARRELLPGGFRILPAEGGGYLWVQLPAGTESRAFLRGCIERQVRILPGADFAPDASADDCFALPVGRLPPPELERTLAELCGRR